MYMQLREVTEVAYSPRVDMDSHFTSESQLLHGSNSADFLGLLRTGGVNKHVKLALSAQANVEGIEEL